ncbi:MAG: hypothetical protein K0M69_15745 [Youngiibacter sp.]|nr:hypothetical protein [Youngiibacter sp.]
MIIEALRDYFLSCSLLAVTDLINVDYLGPVPNQYTIDIVPAQPVIKRYTDGGTLKQTVFILASTEWYSSDTVQNMANLAFYEDLEAWIKEKNNARELPILTGNKRAEAVEILTSGYIFDSTEDNARYQIQLRLVYSED